MMTSNMLLPESDISRSDSQLLLPLDALIRSIGVRRARPHAIFLGAGASISSGIPSAQSCVWEWKRTLFLTNHPGLEDQFSEITLPSVQRRIQEWLDRQGVYPEGGSNVEYGFFIQKCFPIADDRRAYFEKKVRDATPHIGYRLLCRLAQEDLIRSVWTTNFDGLTARAAASFAVTPLEVGIDTPGRAARQPDKGELLCVSLHGDYRYDNLKNTPRELQRQEDALRQALIKEARQRPLIVCGYSGRDHSVMDALSAACDEPGGGALYWCGFGDDVIPECVLDLLRHARAKGKDAFYVPSLGFDDLMTRLSLHCLDGEGREAAQHDIGEFNHQDTLLREPFRIPTFEQHTVIKSNAFEVDCPGEILSFDLKVWPKSKAWSWVREQTAGRPLVAAPFRGKVLALGTVEDIKAAFGDNIEGRVERTPIGPNELRLEDGVVIRLLREALVSAIAQSADIATDGRTELWHRDPARNVRQGNVNCCIHESVLLFLRSIGNVQYVVLKPSIKVLDADGNLVDDDIARPIKLRILGYQHNKPFNRAINKWRSLLFSSAKTAVFEFPPSVGSNFTFRVRRAPTFGQIGLPQGSKAARISEKMRPLLKHEGLELPEPKLLFSDNAGRDTATDTHPVRGVLQNKPYDYPLTLGGLATTLRIGVVCAGPETAQLHAYLQKINQRHRPSNAERDYLLDYPGFQQVYALPAELPEPDRPGWATCAEPSGAEQRSACRSTAQHITRAIESLQSAYAPHVVLVFFPKRWDHLRKYEGENEHFNVHDFVKAYAVQRGIPTQFLRQDTLSDKQQCRVWWWLSLALYVKGMRTPWVLESLDDDTAYVGLGFSIDRSAPKGSHVVLGCSHIYSGRGEGLQYRLSKIEKPIMRGDNPFMSKEDARRTGETIRQLFFDSRMRLPRRVVLHKRTPFLADEREGLVQGLEGVGAIDMLEIQIDKAVRYVASVPKPDGKIDEDNYPVKRGTLLKIDGFSAFLWVHGATAAVNPRLKYFQGKRRIPAPLILRRHAGRTSLGDLCAEILALSKMDWNTFDLYSKMPATLQSSNEIARIGSLLERFGAESYDYRLFI